MTPLDFYRYLLTKGFERRKSQEEMIKLVEEAIDEEETYLIEAPTGTGKTFAYLIPLIVKGERAIISTGTKILQDQLKRDIEFLTGHYELITGRKIKYAILKGKGNYLCLDRFYKEELELPERIEVETFIESEWDGDLTLTSLSVDTITKINVDDDYCTFAYRQTCPYYDRCYYWSVVKKKEASADLLVVNHSLLALKEFETQDRVLVIDEAHELDRYLTLATSFGLSLYWFVELKKSLEKSLGEPVSFGPEEFFLKHFSEKFSEEDKEIPLESLKPYAEDMKKLLYEPIKEAFDRLKVKVLKEVRSFLENRLMVSYRFKDFLISTFLISEDELQKVKAGYEEPTEEEIELINKVKRLEFFKRKLTKLKGFISLAEKEEEGIGYQVERVWSKKLNGYNYRLEAFYIFPEGIIHPEDYKAVILTSATVDPEDIHRATGIQGRFFSLSYNYDYSRCEFVIEDINPKMEEWKDKLLTAYWILRTRYDKVLVLLTNKEHLKLFDEDEEVGVQGRDSLTRLIEFLRVGKIKALIGLDSLWTGVDIKGSKGILMAKLPFENPKDPLTYHRLKYLRSIGEDPFEYQRRKAYIKFRQGVGRLVRQQGDAGTIVLCDNRVWRYREFVEYVKSLGMKIIYKGKFNKRRVFRDFW